MLYGLSPTAKHRSKTVEKADEVYTISIGDERKEAWIQDNGDTTDNWSVRRWNESTMVELSNVLNKNELAKQVAGEMQKTMLLDSEITIRKVLSGLIQGKMLMSKWTLEIDL